MPGPPARRSCAAGVEPTPVTRRLPRALAALSALAGLSGCGQAAPPAPPPASEIGLFTSLPILWRETGDVRELLASDAPPHWAQAVLAARGALRPLDTLDTGSVTGKPGTAPLKAGALLVMAQPRPLSPAENVALDRWVRAGGRVLLFADPMLTAHSDFLLGDARRPQDVVLLSPILTRWGLELRFDDEQPAGEHDATIWKITIPVDLPGSFAPRGGARRCTFAGQGLAARCRVGRGEVIAIADAALLDDGVEAEALGPRRAALDRLLGLLAPQR